MSATTGGPAAATGLDADAVRATRLRAHRLRGPDLPDLPAVVEYFLAVQGQELQPALWGASRRVVPARRPDATTANAHLDAGDVLRTHVLRPTWHLVAPADARWLLALTGPRVRQQMASTERAWGIAAPGPGMEAVAEEVATGPRTRAQLREALVERGLVAADAPGIHVTQLLLNAELEQLVISGPTDGTRQTYAAFDDRVPAGYGTLGERFDRDAAVVELWRRYLPARGLATVRDLQQWSGLTLRDLRRAVQLLVDAGEVVEIPGAGDLSGLTFYGPGSEPDNTIATGAPPVVDLLQAYDELISSYRESRGVVLEPGIPVPDRAGVSIHPVAVDGLVTGRWRWPARSGGDVEVQWLREPTAAERDALDVAVAELRAYLGG